MDQTTRKLMKLLALDRDEVYHVFCLALAATVLDGRVTAEEGEILTRIGFGLGLSPDDISALGQNAREAIEETSLPDVIAFSIAKLKSRLTPEQMGGVKQILKIVVASDRHVDDSERELLDIVDEMWPE
jgi:uncharacterized tellurite resistance protein B-like protein